MVGHSSYLSNLKLQLLTPFSGRKRNRGRMLSHHTTHIKTFIDKFGSYPSFESSAKPIRHANLQLFPSFSPFRFIVFVYI